MYRINKHSFAGSHSCSPFHQCNYKWPCNLQEQSTVEMSIKLLGKCQGSDIILDCMFGLNIRDNWAWLCHKYLYPTLSLYLKVIILLSRGKAEGILCLPLLGLKNLGETEAAHASVLALAFGSELVNPWLPELLFGCRSLPGSPDRAQE